MKAVVLVDKKKMEIQDVQTPVPKDDEVLLKIRASGICTNDIRDYLGSKYSLPRIGGHEYSGEIVALGKDVDINQFSVGQRAVSYIIPACGECHYCRMDKQNLCEKAPTSKIFFSDEGISGYGGFAEYITIKSRDVYTLPDNISFETAAFAEPVACVLNSLNHAKIEIGDDVVVIGGGAMGQLHVMLAKMRGARVILSEPDEKRRELAKTYGCDIVFNPFVSDPVEFIAESTKSKGADVVFNTTSNPIVAEQAVKMTGPSGRCIMFSSIHPNEPISVDAGYVHSKETIITGSVSPTIKSFNQAVNIISKDMIDVSRLIFDTYDYIEYEKAFKAAIKPDTLKVILKFD
ncbi:MAG TPA: alcohol dehydrogenase [Eubacteriaceae bacterium]|nr:alcohol dehydrogenase [Eubacteriaceae bacterium]